MKIVRVEGNRVELTKVVQQFSQLLPLSETNSQARQIVLSSLSEGDPWRHVTLERGLQIIGLVSYQLNKGELRFESLLIRSNQGAKGSHFWLKQLEKIAKLERVKSLSFQLKAGDLLLENRLESVGYQLSAGTQRLWCKRLTYQTALVLAGGGARGAYQIGAWRGLKELGIEFEMIAGTSVGALNGGLILQDDLEVAELMWSQIDTGKILTYPGLNTHNNFSVNAILSDVQRFAFSAVISQGVSTEPLKKLIQDLLDEEKMRSKKQSFFICTTQLPQMKEVVVSYQETPPGEFQRWLLASASFFPAMEATKIADKYYIDGGYRNNIPVDVVLRNGATELIIIDVKGPGLTKPIVIPDDIPVVTIVSPWSLGAVLLFDGSRSKWNIQLGYLETLKAFGRYSGYWYTFDHQLSDPALSRWHRQMGEVLKQGTPEEQKMLGSPQTINELNKKVRNLYQREKSSRLISLYILEYCGKILGVSPTDCYTIETMSRSVKEKLADHWLSGILEEGMLLSLQEWLRLYANELPLPTDKQQVIFFYRQLKAGPPDQIVLSAGGLAPVMYLVAKMLLWLEVN